MQSLFLILYMNKLYPIFLKTDRINILVVGGGKVALEKLHFLYKSSPNSNVKVVSKTFVEDIISMEKMIGSLELIVDQYNEVYLDGIQIVIAATDINEINMKVYEDCKHRGVLVNVADNPEYCDFYMGSIVTKGNLKIGISTNGKSPTGAKRLRQFFEEVLPDSLDELLDNLNKYRNSIKGDFDSKVATMNKLTKNLLDGFKTNFKD